MCTSRWDWAREGWEDENDWGYQIEMDTEPSNDSCWKANWWQGRMNACICCMLVGFWNLPLVLSFENLWEAKERDGTQLAVNIKKKLIEQVQSGKCQTDKCQAVGPKNVYKRIFHKNTNPQKTIAEPVIPKSKIPRKLLILLYSEMTSAINSFLTDMCYWTFSATAFLNSLNEINSWQVTFAYCCGEGREKNHFFKGCESGLVMKKL